MHINRYEKDVYVPDTEMVQKLVGFLRKPLALFHIEYDDVAEFIMIFYSLFSEQREDVIAYTNCLKVV